MQDMSGPAFVFTEAPNDPAVSHSTYENEDGIFFFSTHERPAEGGQESYLVNIFNMGDPGEREGQVVITPFARLLCIFTAEWISADPEVNVIESAEDAAMNWLDAEDVQRDSTLALRFTPDEPEGEERDWPAGA